jgi:hypothetical protein
MVVSAVVLIFIVLPVNVLTYKVKPGASSSLLAGALGLGAPNSLLKQAKHAVLMAGQPRERTSASFSSASCKQPEKTAVRPAIVPADKIASDADTKQATQAKAAGTHGNQGLIAESLKIENNPRKMIWVSQISSQYGQSTGTAD